MSLIKIEIENIKSISLTQVQIEQGKVNLLKGQNGAGKSTLIDSLFSALLGSRQVKHFQKYNTNNIIKEDKETARIEMQLQNGIHTIDIKREIRRTADGADFRTLKVSCRTSAITTKDVVKMFRQVSIDLSKFLNMDNLEQFQYLQEIIDKDKMLQINSDISNLTNDLHLLNTDKLNTDARIRNATVTQPVEVPSITNITNEIQELEKEKNDISQTKQMLETLEIDRQEKQQRFEEYKSALERLQTDIGKINHQITLQREKSLSLQSYETIEQKITTKKMEVQSYKDKITKSEIYQKYQDDIAHKNDLLESLREKQDNRKQLETKKNALFKEAGIDVEISWTEETGVVLDGKILKDMSSGQQIVEVSKIIQATFKENEIRLIIVRNANNLDSNSLQKMSDSAKKYNITFLLEWVSNNEEEITIEVFEK